MFHLFIIGTETTQRLSIISGTRSKNDTTSSKIAEISPKATNVSLQKYIIGVSSTYGNEGANTLGTNRNNKYAVSKNEDLWDIKYDYNHTGVNISSGNNVSTSNITGYNKSTKKETPVQIEAGDKVTYKIAVYNNSNVKASYIKIKDFYQGENATITEKKAMKTSGSTSLTYGNAGTLSQAGVTQEANDDNGNTVFSFSLEGHERLAIYITVRYNSYSNSTLRNRAWISSTTPSNKKTYRTIDADYIKMKQYSVSLEKFVSKVNDISILKYDVNGDGEISIADCRLIALYLNEPSTLTDEQILKADINKDGEVTEDDVEMLHNIIAGSYDVNGDGEISATDLRLIALYLNEPSTLTDEQIVKADINKDGEVTEDDVTMLQNIIVGSGTDVREGHRYNEFASTIENKDDYKPNNKVEVEPGDIVTYTIRLKNTGDTPVKITEIYDSFKFIEEGDYKGLKLFYQSSYGIQGNGGGTITNYHYGDDKDNANKSLDRYLIQFNNAPLLKAGEYQNVTIKFKVEVSPNLTASEQILQNKAVIVSLKNKNDIPVSDSDGTDNNADMDWVKTKTYAVSLEKYISKVNNVSVHDLKYDVNGDGAVDLKDVELILKYIAKQPVNLNGKGDINDDGTINMKDDLALRKIIREGKPEHKYDDDANTNNDWKHNNVVTVQNGDKVTYTIKVKNDSTDTSVYITEITDYLPDGVKYAGITYNGGEYDKQTDNAVKFNGTRINGGKILAPGESTSFTVTVTVTEPNISLKTLQNTAEISGMKNKNNVTVKDTTPNNNKDSDYIKLDWTPTPVDKKVTKVWDDKDDYDGIRPSSIRVQLYKDGETYGEPVSLSIVNQGSSSNEWVYTWTGLPKQENGKDIKYTVKELNENGEPIDNGGKYNDEYNETTYSTDTFIITNTHKPENPPPPPDDDTTTKTVIKVWDDANNKYGKRPSDIKVQLYKTVNNSTTKVGGEEILNSSNGWTHTWTDLDDNDAIVYSVREVSVPDGYTVSYSSDTFTITNKYPGITEEKQKDAVISGIVWNDIATNKTSDNYDGLYQKSNEQLLSGIKVLLYRNGVARRIAETTTDSNGYYYFNNDSIDANVVTNPCERYIKAPIKSTTDNKWDETKGYYSYYVVFEYDGITYTSTFDGNGNRIWDIKNNDGDKQYSNAKEDGAKVEESRINFNREFDTIDNTSGIEYTTKNDAGYIPQSNHIYNPNTMAIQSSTNLINLNNFKNSEEKLEHVNLGLRGRDVFDLELTSDVVSTEVRVNGVDGTYNYGNKVTVRRNDLSSMYNVKEDMAKEDMANVYGAGSQYDGGEYEQKVRKTDIDADQTGAGTTEGTKKYDSTGLGIKVTYRITVTNASQTDGTATKIINYYDNRYTFKGAYANKADAEAQRSELEHEEGTSGTGYKSVLVTTKGNNLTQGASMDIYLVYSLNSPTSTLSGLLSNEKLPTYNMAEIYEYKTKCGNSQTEYTRGLIDKDSAPGSVATEKVRLASGNSTDTTLGYYFKAQNLQNLKYEDDTYAAPTLYFVSDDSTRTINGTVFEDITELTEENVRTGNGIKDGEEPGINGVKVQLLEQVSNDYQGEFYPYNGNKYVARYKTDTIIGNGNNNYQFTGFLPGNYIIQYTYGEKDETFIITPPNTKSYNGEDFQSTNNTGKYGAAKLSDKQNYWYIDNETEKVSTATEDKDRRQDVSNYFIGDNSDEKITVLNNARDGKKAAECAVKYGDNQTINAKNVEDNSYMYADTKNMKFEVEKVTNNNGDKNNSFESYIINGMNFGIAEVPVTEINLQKSVKEFTIKDSTGSNTIAQLTKGDDGKWNTKGDVIPAGNILDVQIEDEKLQGAKLEVTYDIIANMRTEKNFNNSKAIKANITGIVDFIDNNLSYSDNLGENSRYWEVTQFDTTSNTFAAAQYMEGTVPRGTIDPDGTKHTTIVKAKEGNPILLKEDGTARAPITLEKILSSVDSRIEDIITSTVDTYEYSNIVEITGLDYTNVNDGGNVLRDRIRTKDRYIILPGVQHDSATSEKITIHTPTGDNNINIIYYVIASVSLVVIAAGVFSIKKFVLKNNK